MLVAGGLSVIGVASVDSKLASFTAETIQRLFTATKIHGDWPQAELQTQWPSPGTIGWDVATTHAVFFVNDVYAHPPVARLPQLIDELACVLGKEEGCLL
jgi:hypothetical protein